MTWLEFDYEDDDGNEEVGRLPARYEVCPRCQGHGTHLNPSIGEHAYTPEEFNEEFSDEEDREQYFRRGGIYDVRCEECKGERVVLEVDEDEALRSCPDLLERYLRVQEAEAEDRAIRAAERRMGA